MSMHFELMIVHCGIDKSTHRDADAHELAPGMNWMNPERCEKLETRSDPSLKAAASMASRVNTEMVVLESPGIGRPLDANGHSVSSPV